MMYLDDIDRRRSRTGCFALIGLAALIVVGVVWFVWGRGDRLPAESEEEVTAALAERLDSVAPVEETVEPAATATTSGRRAAPRTAQTASAPVSDQPRGEDRSPQLLEEAKAARERDDFLRARELGWQVLEQTRSSSVREAADALLGEVNIELVTTPRPMPEKIEYTIRPGDMLYLIARRHGVNLELLHHSNRIRGPIERPSIRPGDIIRILQADFSIEVSKTRNDLVLKMNDKFFKRYPVGTGEYASTPIGDFKIVNRMAEPVWYRPSDGRVIPFGHEENLLGTHWLGLDARGYGIHGTWAPETIGYQMSDGCVRMLNEDVKELFMLVTEGTPVRIVE